MVALPADVYKAGSILSLSVPTACRMLLPFPETAGLYKSANSAGKFLDAGERFLGSHQ